ncbi:histone-lysine N-methyltransferase SETDB2 isoform X2 [Chelmon rostratus]|uniref:histone-lysine N-methyltransferase SETDB2 isoform X2 n=1 Tax=Chelmon rostratus TaxID=109905 RepID=UPI001BE6C86A|nr:histone-lysine N-methyltransferase SETDB2 isoform X2 [Chelmon rostratus]
MEKDSLDPEDVERARTFWAEEDVEQVFNGVFQCLDHLKRVLQMNTATDKEYVRALKLLQCLDCFPPASTQDSSVVQVVIGSGVLLPADSHLSPSSSHSSSPLPPYNGPSSPVASPDRREELLPPLTSVQLQYQLHTCCKACLSSLPSMPQSMPPFWGQNPLKVPLLCGFKRLTAVPRMSLRGGGDADEEGVSEGMEDGDVVYKTPCGHSLRNHDDVMRFLLATDSYDVLRRPEVDLSRGVEPTPVELCAGDSGARPADFRYRKDRWPCGCFLSRGPTLFNTCCDCTDGCTDAQRCACVALTRGGRCYTHHRLYEPVLTGVYECGPWCGCDRARCQNRLVQRGIRVRLQVFPTDDRGWGVRCRDDLDRGTFVCIYAGVMLQRVHSPAEPPAPKLTRMDLPSDDEVEVVTEWLALPVLEQESNLLEPTSPSLHVPVIQRPTDSNTTPQDRDKTVLVGGPEPPSPSAGGSGDQSPAQDKTVTLATAAVIHGMNGAKAETKSKGSLKREMKVEDMNFLDASKEGNVGRFINHSCQPNLFIQNVFTDSHDPGYPVIAFFTSRVVKAGTELTWNYSADTQRKQEVPCLCGSNGCQGHFTIEENLCDM